MTESPAPADRGELADRFEELRPYLRAVAYRMLGSLAEAEDAVQDAWLRLDRAGGAGVEDLRGWLTVVVSRLCLDQLRSARVRRETYVGPWLPEPLVTAPAADGGAATDGLPPAGLAGPGMAGPGMAGSGGVADPADRVTLAESVSMAMLIVFETLTPAERTAFVLHDVFGFDFAAVGAAVGRSPEACRALASRARRHVRARAPRFDPDPAAARRVTEAFLAAAAGGDVGVLTNLLAADVVLRSDGGGVVSAARRPVLGADRVARFFAGLLAKGARLPTGPPDFRFTEINGAPGVVAIVAGRLYGVYVFTVADGAITDIDVVLNPAKLRPLAAALGGLD